MGLLRTGARGTPREVKGHPKVRAGWLEAPEGSWGWCQRAGARPSGGRADRPEPPHASDSRFPHLSPSRPTATFCSRLHRLHLHARYPRTWGPPANAVLMREVVWGPVNRRNAPHLMEAPQSVVARWEWDRTSSVLKEDQNLGFYLKSPYFKLLVTNSWRCVCQRVRPSLHLPLTPAETPK